jgi:thiol-disulfide isomerase/thioredoxin
MIARVTSSIGVPARARRGHAAVVLLAVLAAAVLAFLFVRGTGDAVVVAPGTPAPEFTASTLETVPRVKRLRDYRGQVVLLNLWATWCEPCKIEMPSIEELHRAYGPAGLKVVAVAVDDPGFEERVRRYVAERGLTFEVLSEGTGTIERQYQARGIPATYLIGRDGIIRKRIAGASDWSSPANRALVAQLLGAAGTAVR